MKLNIESLSIPLSTQLLHCGACGAKHQLQVSLWGGGGLWAWSWGLRVHCPAIQTHTAPLGVPLQPVPLPWSKSGLSCHTATTTIPLHVALLTQNELFKHTGWHESNGGGPPKELEGGSRCIVDPLRGAVNGVIFPKCKNILILQTTK